MDDNDKPLIYGVSHLDGKTPVCVAFNPVTRAMLIDETTSIAFDPTLGATKPYFPFAEATSEIDNKTIKPWVVNASTGAVLIET